MYDSDHHHHLLHDLADAVTDRNALDQAVSVLVEWDIIGADLAREYMEEMLSNPIEGE